jgi:hypothetical protein
MELDSANFSESHPSIEFDGVMVFRADVEPGDEAFAAMILDYPPDKACSVALAAMGGVGADTADLGVAVEDQTLAAHGD